MQKNRDISYTKYFSSLSKCFFSNAFLPGKIGVLRFPLLLYPPSPFLPDAFLSGKMSDKMFLDLTYYWNVQALFFQTHFCRSKIVLLLIPSNAGQFKPVFTVTFFPCQNSLLYRTTKSHFYWTHFCQTKLMFWNTLYCWTVKVAFHQMCFCWANIYILISEFPSMFLLDTFSPAKIDILRLPLLLDCPSTFLRDVFSHSHNWHFEIPSNSSMSPGLGAHFRAWPPGRVLAGYPDWLQGGSPGWLGFGGHLLTSWLRHVSAKRMNGLSCSQAGPRMFW